MILSASGWRKVFAESGNENDATTEIGNENRLLASMAAESFAEYILQKNNMPVVVCGYDARPTSQAIADAVLRTLLAKKIIVQFTGVTAAPEIMAFAKKFDGFVYITASHNPVGHNGIKFGLNDGGVLEASENKKIIKIFEEKCADQSAAEKATKVLAQASNTEISTVYASLDKNKQKSLDAYEDFVKETVTAVHEKDRQEKIFDLIKEGLSKKNIGVVCDFNGSARVAGIDKDFFGKNGISFYSINNEAGKIAHGIIPEGKNLEFCAEEMRKLQKSGKTEFMLGYMPDCDGDRGNIVYWDEQKNDAVVMAAQEVFSLSVFSELYYSEWLNKFSAGNATGSTAFKPAVCVNCPTSMRIEKIAGKFNAEVFRAEVGEANVVNLARQKRAEGYTVRILGEGSNGGTITYPAAVRDPLNTIFAFIKLLMLGDENIVAGGKKDFSLADVLSTLPVFSTTPVSEERAVVHLKTKDQTALKKNFQKVFESEWKSGNSPAQKFGFNSYKISLTNGIKETRNASDMSESGTGGLKILFYRDNEAEASGKEPCAFMWMRGSQTEPLFRVMCDVEGNNPEMEKKLLEWERQMIEKSDN